MLLFDFSQSIFCDNRCPFIFQKYLFSFTAFPFKQFGFSDSNYLIAFSVPPHSGCFPLFVMFPCPPFPKLFLFFLLGVVASNFPLIICIKFAYLSFTSLSLFHPLSLDFHDFFFNFFREDSSLLQYHLAVGDIIILTAIQFITTFSLMCATFLFPCTFPDLLSENSCSLLMFYDTKRFA
jgi:hypothetical protein